MEIFDVYDGNRNFLNYTKQRGEKLTDNEYNLGSELWIINNNKILMTKRSKNKSHPGMWETPGGCSITGETTKQTIIREISEELGITIPENNIAFIATKLYKKQFVDIYSCNTKIYISSIKIQESEVCDVKYISKEEFNLLKNKNLIVPSVLERFNIIKNKIDIDW